MSTFTVVTVLVGSVILLLLAEWGFRLMCDEHRPEDQS